MSNLLFGAFVKISSQVSPTVPLHVWRGLWGRQWLFLSANPGEHVRSKDVEETTTWNATRFVVRVRHVMAYIFLPGAFWGPFSLSWISLLSLLKHGLSWAQSLPVVQSDTLFQWHLPEPVSWTLWVVWKSPNTEGFEADQTFIACDKKMRFNWLPL